MKIYIASSWRNRYQPAVVVALRKAGHEVYDFRNPQVGDNGFHWSEIDEAWQAWTVAEFQEALKHPIAQSGFDADFEAMQWAEACVLLLPSGRSAHLEAGWFIGQGKASAIYLPRDMEAYTPDMKALGLGILDEMPSGCEPELMYKLANAVCGTMGEVLSSLAAIRAREGDVK